MHVAFLLVHSFCKTTLRWDVHVLLFNSVLDVHAFHLCTDFFTAGQSTTFWKWKTDELHSLPPHCDPKLPVWFSQLPLSNSFHSSCPSGYTLKDRISATKKWLFFYATKKELMNCDFQWQNIAWNNPAVTARYEIRLAHSKSSAHPLWPRKIKSDVLLR